MTEVKPTKAPSSVASHRYSMEVDPEKLQVAPDSSKVGTLKYPLLTHEKVDTRPTTNIKMKQYLCVKHALPKTRLTNAILYENVSQERHLELQMSSISHRRGRTLNSMDINKRAFMAQQDRKRRKWKREDEVRLAGMNLPTISPLERRSDAEVMYHSHDETRAESAGLGRKPILPMMKFRRERTEIVLHNDKTFITKLPAFVEVNENIQTVFDAYRGKAYLSRDLPSRDERFRRLATTLQPSSRPEGDEIPRENITSKSKRGIRPGTQGTSDSGCFGNYAEARIMIASRGQSRDQARSRPAVDYVTESTGLRKADILHSFKNHDLKELSKSLTRETHIDLADVRLPPSDARNIPSAIARRKTSASHVPSNPHVSTLKLDSKKT